MCEKTNIHANSDKMVSSTFWISLLVPQMVRLECGIYEKGPSKNDILECSAACGTCGFSCLGKRTFRTSPLVLFSHLKLTSLCTQYQKLDILFVGSVDIDAFLCKSSLMVAR